MLPIFDSSAVIAPADLAALLPETRAQLTAWAWRYGRRFQDNEDEPTAVEAPVPTFPYQALPPSARLRYELVDWPQLPHYLTLFGADPSPFVDERFKQRASLEAYGAALLTELRYSWKRGACDWLLRRQSDGQLIGVLHLYELSHEVIAGRIAHCCVGYALVASARREGYGNEALHHLLAQTARLFGRTEARALSAAANEASEALLRRCGFKVLEDRPLHKYEEATRLWTRELG